MSHYIAPFTWRETRYPRQQRAVCGAWIFPYDHSPEPSCATCLAYVESEIQTAKELQEKWDLEQGTKVIHK